MSNPLAAFMFRWNLAYYEENAPLCTGVDDAIALANKAEPAIESLVTQLYELPIDQHSDAVVQKIFYNVGNEFFPGGGTNLRLWFKIVYRALTGDESGPRLGLLCTLVGVTQAAARIDRIRYNGWMNE